jgi:hypothetical protein
MSPARDAFAEGNATERNDWDVALGAGVVSLPSGCKAMQRPASSLRTKIKMSTRYSPATGFKAAGAGSYQNFCNERLGE